MSDLFDPLAAPFRLEGTNGSAVVMVHGFTGTPAHWRLAAPVVHEAGYTVVAPRLPGHGTTVDDLAGTYASDWIRAVVQAIDDLADHRSVHLAGLSMGGLACIEAAAQRQVASLTTVNTPLRYRNRVTYLAPVLHRFRPYVSWPEAPEPDLDPEARPLWITYSGFPTRQLAEVVRLARRANRTAGTLRVPALVIQSRTDETVDPTSAPRLCRAFGGPCRVVWLRQSLHSALLDRERDTIHEELLGHIAQADVAAGDNDASG